MRLQIRDDRLAVRLNPIGEGYSRLTVEFPRDRKEDVYRALSDLLRPAEHSASEPGSAAE